MEPKPRRTFALLARPSLLCPYIRGYRSFRTTDCENVIVFWRKGVAQRLGVTLHPPSAADALRRNTGPERIPRLQPRKKVTSDCSPPPAEPNLPWEVRDSVCGKHLQSALPCTVLVLVLILDLVLVLPFLFFLNGDQERERCFP
ncbi:hypothetical protein EYF80_000274 [Liparis tanakae]|uniref:Uncharacterized protein n=1 Tax=Liparis tanakae TaxID=230148 RepID=A0A4Z2JIB3_9TELE|nr:hypothetical protein EYF80_000274 [Liparis tanakae]